MSLIRFVFLQMACFAACFNCEQATEGRDSCKDDDYNILNFYQFLMRMHQRLERMELQDRSSCSDQEPNIANITQLLERMSQRLGQTERDRISKDEAKFVNITQSLGTMNQRLGSIQLSDNNRASRPACPPGFNHSASVVSKCYAVVTQPLSWDDAQTRCRQLHRQSHLIVINSALENQIISKILQNYETRQISDKGPNNGTHYHNNFWTSGRRLNDSCASEFQWKPTATYSQELGYNNWCNVEPNCAFRQEHCLSLAKSCANNAMGWNDNVCSWRLYSVCEILLLDD